MPDPSYCSTLQTVNSVPPQADMELFRPYFTIPDGCTCIDVFILVPSRCYSVESDEPNCPSGGACGAAGDLQNTIYIGLDPGCSDSTPTVLKRTLNYEEDPSGSDIVIYCVDGNTGHIYASGSTKTVR